MGTYENPFEFDFDSYIRQVEPSKQEKGKNWATAIGLQKVDGLTPSKYLYETAKRNIEGEISIEKALHLITAADVSFVLAGTSALKVVIGKDLLISANVISSVALTDGRFILTHASLRNFLSQ